MYETVEEYIFSKFSAVKTEIGNMLKERNKKQLRLLADAVEKFNSTGEVPSCDDFTRTKKLGEIINKIKEANDKRISLIDNAKADAKRALRDNYKIPTNIGDVLIYNEVAERYFIKLAADELKKI